MAQRRRGSSSWSKAFSRGLASLTRQTVRQTLRLGQQTLRATLKAASAAAAPPKPRVRRPARPKPVAQPRTRGSSLASGGGDWLGGVVVGTVGGRRFRLYRPPGLRAGERLPLMVMLHGCGQDATAFAQSTRMNQLAARQRFLVLYPEQDRLAHAQRCWNWYDTRSGRAFGEAGLIMQMIDRVCLRHRADPLRVAIAGLSAGASMAALVATRYPERFRAVAMHSGIPPGCAHSTLSALGAMNGHRRPASAAPSWHGPADTPWPPLLVIHGHADGVVAPDNGRHAARMWAEAAGARPAPVREVQRGQRHPMTVTDFKHRGGTASTLVEVSHLGHAWSGGAARQAFSDRHGPDASRLVWAFAARQFRAYAAAQARNANAARGRRARLA